MKMASHSLHLNPAESIDINMWNETEQQQRLDRDGATRRSTTTWWTPLRSPSHLRQPLPLLSIEHSLLKRAPRLFRIIPNMHPYPKR